MSGRPLSFAERAAQCLVNGRIGIWLEPVSGEVRELLVAQERCQGRDALLGADERKLAAGIGLFLERRV